VPAICRGNSVDADVTHCSTPRRSDLSPNVFVNGIGISRQSDNNTPHLLPGAPCPTHAAPIAVGSTTVFINNLGCGRIGDGITACTSVATGSSDSFAGP
jgi:uncharacterized Zn-binding protein involved in type VI secretion